MPDSVFIEDPAIVLDEVALIGRMGAVKRRAEAESLAPVLSAVRPLKFMDGPGTLEGGDRVRIGRTLFVGVSSRTNMRGVEQLRTMLGPYDYEVRPVKVKGCLHLTTGCSYIGRHTVLMNPDWIDAGVFKDFEIITTPPEEPWAANTIATIPGRETWTIREVGGRYRIIDFVLSNFVNSGILSIYVLTQFKAQSLLEHLDRGWRTTDFLGEHFVIPVPAQMRSGEDWYQGTADSVYQNLYLLERHSPKLVAVFGADHIYRMNIRQMIDEHQKKNADVTVAALPVRLDEATQFGVIGVDPDWRIGGFDERLTYACYEDLEFARRVHDGGRVPVPPLELTTDTLPGPPAVWPVSESAKSMNSRPTPVRSMNAPNSTNMMT